MNWFKGRHFNHDIITVAVGYYFRFNLSYRDIVEIMADRGVSVHHTTTMRWVHHYDAIFRRLWSRHRQATSQSWRVGETYIKVNGSWNYLYRAIDNQGLTLDFSLRKQRDYLAAYHFLKRLLNCLATDQYGATLKAIKQVAKDGLLDLKSHQCSKYRNNLIEQDHRFIKRHRVQSAGFQNIRTVASTLAGVEVIHAMRKETRRNGSIFGFSVITTLQQMLVA